MKQVPASLPLNPRPRPTIAARLWRTTKYTVVGLLPLAVLLAGAEALVRTVLKPSPPYRTPGLYEEVAGLNVPDPDLFWRNPKNFTTIAYGQEVRTNRYGLRGPDFPLEKAPDEYRILMLGESTTFGAGVAGAETYSAVLETLLNGESSGRKVRVINAGISAYSSFQSLMYLKIDGLAFRPDLVIIYHEVNDYLPASIRTSGNTEVGTSLSDPELHRSSVNRLSRYLLEHWKLYETVSLLHARWSLKRMQDETVRSPLLDIGFPDIAIRPKLFAVDPNQVRSYRNVPRRVRPEERKAILQEFLAICSQRRIGLIVIHPAYADSRKHACVLTEFVRDTGVLSVEAFDALHGEPGLFLDPFHPNVQGHRRLARSLAQTIIENGLLR